ncbi:hypothetical protein BD410DRAFT_780264 [Rickenella mellea]|uniref:Uncharacterized protein n=1 Tax=Rickenella mellea TaxID=50990 RepID=A0A4R5XGM6_9AGAM|nr:hypothetical protein BD410DRAFT_780264 [Rickenella mellea]
MFGTRTSRTRHHHHTTGTRTGRRGWFHRTDPDRRAGGLKAALHNPNTTHAGRRNAKAELRMMGRGREAHGHPSVMSRIRHMFGIRSKTTRRRYREY